MHFVNLIVLLLISVKMNLAFQSFPKVSSRMMMKRAASTGADINYKVAFMFPGQGGEEMYNHLHLCYLDIFVFLQHNSLEWAKIYAKDLHQLKSYFPRPRLS